MANPFWNSQEGRLRAFWRLLIQYVVYLVGSILIRDLLQVLLAVALLAQPGAEGLAENPAALRRVAIEAMSQTPFQFVTVLGSLVAVFFAVWLAARYLDHRPFRDFGFHFSPGWWRDFGFGLALGAVLMSLIFVVEQIAGWITITGTLSTPKGGPPFSVAILLALLIFIGVGLREELLSRGYQLLNVAEGLNLPHLGPRVALLLAWLGSSLFFGLLHLGNPNTSLISTVNLVIAGLFLGLGYVLTGELAIPIGLHITWNFFEGNVFGFPVSGGTAGPTLIAIQQGGPELWTGGAFGPEAGLVGILAMLAGSLAVLAWVSYRTGRIGLCTRLADPPAVKEMIM